MAQRTISNYARRGIWLFLLGTAYYSGMAFSAAPEPGITARGRVINVVDGDTIDISVTRIVRVRLLDCWAPEKHMTDVPGEKAKGILAANEMTRVALNKPVILFVPTTDDLKDSLSLDRALGKVWLADSQISLSEYMVEKGLATKTKQK